jgi:hypothetical protein
MSTDTVHDSPPRYKSVAALITVIVLFVLLVWSVIGNRPSSRFFPNLFFFAVPCILYWLRTKKAKD